METRDISFLGTNDTGTIVGTNDDDAAISNNATFDDQTIADFGTVGKFTAIAEDSHFEKCPVTNAMNMTETSSFGTIGMFKTITTDKDDQVTKRFLTSILTTNNTLQYSTLPQYIILFSHLVLYMMMPGQMLRNDRCQH